MNHRCRMLPTSPDRWHKPLWLSVAVLASVYSMVPGGPGACRVASGASPSQSILVEAEDFVFADGWRVIDQSASVREASGTAVLATNKGARDVSAEKTVKVPEAARYRIWVRYRRDPRSPAPFRLVVTSGDRALSDTILNTPTSIGHVESDFFWEHADVQLPAGAMVLTFSTKDLKPAQGGSRQIDCVLLTDDFERQPNHMDHGPRVYLRVTLNQGYDRPVYLHLFADFFQRKERGNFSISKAGLATRWPKRPGDYLTGGDQTDWIDVTSLLCRHGGARLCMMFASAAGYTDRAPMRARFEFANAPSADAVVRVIERDEPAAHGAIFLRTPRYTTAFNALEFMTDEQYAMQVGKLADGMAWPSFGKPPSRFPFLVTEHTASSGSAGASARFIVEREQQTLRYFGFNPTPERLGGGMWGLRDNKCYSQPQLDRMHAVAAQRARQFREGGGDLSHVAYAMLTDEPQGHTAAHLAGCKACGEAFGHWVREELHLTPADLLVSGWEQVVPIEESGRDRHPALHYFTQRFRTRVLANYMTIQQRLMHEAHAADFPVNANISGGNAVFYGNFYSQGVDYFELLDDGRLNGLWSADWANLATTYQMGSYNAALMQAASRRHGQHLGMYLIAYAGRLGWDIKAKAVSQAARGVKVLNSFYYGPMYSRNEGTPWSQRPEVWRAHAEVVREFGGAEDVLLAAEPVQPQAAILYSSSSDIWTQPQPNFAWGFDRKHLWLALTHVQIPVTFVSERDVERGLLKNFKVCYLSGPNLTGLAAKMLEKWVGDGGTLVLTAGGAARDEYDRPLTGLPAILPAKRAEIQILEAHTSYGRALTRLQVRGECRIDDATLQVFSARQDLSPHAGAQVLGRFDDGSAALVRGAYGQGRVYCFGMLPGLSYIRPALDAQARHVEAVVPSGIAPAIVMESTRDADDDAERGPSGEEPGSAPSAAGALARSYNPWEFPADIRRAIVAPAIEAGIDLPIRCSVPVVDAVLMQAPEAAVIPLSNWSLQPLSDLQLTVRTAREVQRVVSVRHGELPWVRDGKAVRFSLPLQETDFVILHH